MSTAASFVIVLGVLIFFHELGHFIVARLFGVGVQTFSLGFGPKVWKKTVGITQYCLSAIPLGGYVKMVVDETGADLAPEEIPLSFNHKKLYQKSLIVAAGPFFNFLLAVVIFTAIFGTTGYYLIKPVVGEVMENTPAQEAGFRAGDVILQIQDVPVESWSDMVALIGASNGQAIKVLIGRDGSTLSKTLKPRAKEDTNIFGESISRWVIGIAASGETIHRPIGPVEAVGAGLMKTWEIIELTLLSIVKIFTGSVSAKTLGGPIMIAQMAGEQAQAGVSSLAFFIALLSVNLGIINLFPIPVLDGGHLLFFGIEAISGKAVSDGIKERATQFGIVLLMGIMVFAFYNDILRIFNGG